MFLELVTGSGLLLVNIVIVALTGFLMEVAFRRMHPWLTLPPQRIKLLLLLIGTGIAVLAVVTAGVWIWALAYLALGLMPDTETAVYFSLVSFTTLGFGDVVLTGDWRLLSGMEAANGFLTFGFLIALLGETFRQVRVLQLGHHRRD